MTRRAWLPWVLIPLAAAALVAFCAAIRPYPFTAGDGLLRYLPLIQAHTDSLLSGAPLRMLWSLGAGWDPAHSGEMGVAYLPYHAANLLARLAGRPLALLEVSAWMHLAAAGLVAWRWLPEEVRGPERGALAGLFVVLPGPFLMGLNWPSYLAAYPWFLALALLAGRPCLHPGRRILALLGTATGFYLAAHVQMFTLGCGLLLLARAAGVGGPRDAAGLKALVVALLPFAVPLAFVKMVSLHASLGWQGAWAAKDLLVREAQPLGIALAGLGAGNLAPLRSFQVLGDAPWVGVGMFFAPWVLAAAVLDLLRRRWTALAFWLLLLLLLGARSFPFLSHLAVGPLAGFRWTWKLMLFAGPLGVLACLDAAPWRALGSRPRLTLGLLAAGLSLAVCLRGLPFICSHGAGAFAHLGAAAMVADTRAALARCGLEPGQRLALADAAEGELQPVALAVLPGNGALLCGYESAHLFEPLDDAVASAERYGLSSQAFLSPAFLRQPFADAWLARIGIQAVVAAGPLPGPDVRTTLDGLGRRIWVRPVKARLPGPYPWAKGGVALDRLPGGRLRSREPRAEAPRLVLSRPMTWRQEPDGRWTGTPAGIPVRWWVAGGLVLALCLAYAVVLERRAAPPA